MLNSGSGIASPNPARLVESRRPRPSWSPRQSWSPRPSTPSTPSCILFSTDPPPQDLLRQCIRVEVGERLSLEAILCHPWLLPNNNSSNNCNDPNKISTSSNSGVLGGLPIPNRDHATKGMNHPQVNFFPAIHNSSVQAQILTNAPLCSPWTVWGARPRSLLPRRST